MPTARPESSAKVRMGLTLLWIKGSSKWQEVPRAMTGKVKG